MNSLRFWMSLKGLHAQKKHLAGYTRYCFVMDDILTVNLTI